VKLPSGDAFWLRAESDAVPSGWACALGLEPGSAITIDQLREQVAERLTDIPWATWRTHRPRLGRPRWLSTPSLPIERMVHAERAEDALARAGELAMERFDADLPMWRVRLVETPDHRQHVIVTAHHSFAGGYSGTELLERLLGGERTPSTATPYVPPTGVPASTRAKDAAWSVASSAYRVLQQLRSPRWEAARAGAPLVGPISSAPRSVAVAGVPLARIEAIGAAYGAGSTRVLVTLVAMALDDLARRSGTTAPALRALFPHGTQEGPVTMPGNAARSTYLDLPLEVPPAERLVAVREAFARNAIGSAELPAVVDVTLTMPVAYVPMGVAGRRITSMALAGPLRVCSQAHTRLTIVVQRYGGSAWITFVGDGPSLGSEVGALADRLRDACDRLERDAPVVAASPSVA